VCSVCFRLPPPGATDEALWGSSSASRGHQGECVCGLRVPVIITLEDHLPPNLQAKAAEVRRLATNPLSPQAQPCLALEPYALLSGLTPCPVLLAPPVLPHVNRCWLACWGSPCTTRRATSSPWRSSRRPSRCSSRSWSAPCRPSRTRCPGRPCCSWWTLWTPQGGPPRPQAPPRPKGTRPKGLQPAQGRRQPNACPPHHSSHAGGTDPRLAAEAAGRGGARAPRTQLGELAPVG